VALTFLPVLVATVLLLGTQRRTRLRGEDLPASAAIGTGVILGIVAALVGAAVISAVVTAIA
jgi:hypothetical protein